MRNMARLVFTNANLLDGEHAAQAGSTVVVDGDRIVSVDPVPPVETATRSPAGTEPGDRVFDLAGRTLMPGMVSCHFHATYHELGSKVAPFGLEEPPALQAVRAVRNLEGVLKAGFTSAVSAGAPFAIDPAMRRAIAEGAVAGPRFVPGSRDVSTTGHVNDSAPWYWEVGGRGASHLRRPHRVPGAVSERRSAKAPASSRCSSRVVTARWAPPPSGLRCPVPTDGRRHREAAHERGCWSGGTSPIGTPSPWPSTAAST